MRDGPVLISAARHCDAARRYHRGVVCLRARHLRALAALVALAFLTKATAALVDVFAPILVWLAVQRRLALLARPRVLRWAALSACTGLWWYAAALALVPNAPARLHEFFFVPLGAGHSDLASDHYHSPFWYLPRFLGVAAPAILLLPFVVRDSWRSRFWRDSPVLRFAATSALALFVAWSIIPQKGRHYLLPIRPLRAARRRHALRWRGAGRPKPRADDLLAALDPAASP